MASNYQSDMDSSLTVDTFNVRPYWMGDYDENLINCNCSGLEEELPFHVAIVNSQRDQNEKLAKLVLVVPAYWVDQTYRFVLHPHPDFNINGMYPRDWNEMAFNRRRYPTDKFVEYEIADFGTEMSVSFEDAKSKYADIMEEFENEISDRDQNEGYAGSEKSYTTLTRTVPTSPEVLSSRRLEVTGEDIQRPLESFYTTPKSDVATTSFSNIGQRPFYSTPSSALSSFSSYTPKLTDNEVASSQHRFDSVRGGKGTTLATEECREFRQQEPAQVTKCFPRYIERPVSVTGGRSSSPFSLHIGVRRQGVAKKPNAFTQSLVPKVPAPLGIGVSIKGAGTSKSQAVSPFVRQNESVPITTARSGSPAAIGIGIPRSGVMAIKSKSLPQSDSIGVPKGGAIVKKATTESVAPTLPKTNHITSSRRPSEETTADHHITDQEFRSKMLKLAAENVANSAKTVQLLEAQRNPKLVQERIVTENARHFQQFMAANVNLPLTEPDQIAQFDSALANMELSVAVASYHIMRFRCISSKDKIAKQLLLSLFTADLCTRICWKFRASDKRPMIGHLINLVAVFVVVIQGVLEMNNQSRIKLPDLFETIKSQRRLITNESKGLYSAATQEGTRIKTDTQTKLDIQQRATEVEEAIANFRLAK